MKLVKVQGYLKYDPARSGMKNYNGNWVVLQLPESLSKYYQYFIKTEMHIPVQSPRWQTHVSIVRGEDYKNKNVWKKYNNKLVNIYYYPHILKIKDPKKPGYYFVIEFECKFFDKIRKELGLVLKYKKYHFTIGRIDYD